MTKLTELFVALAAVLLLPIPSMQATETDVAPAHPEPSLKAGIQAPDFTRKTSNGKEIVLSSYRGKKPVILYFYPKDETPQCTKEACAFRDFFNGMKGADAEIIGVSGDSDQSHEAFALHHQLPFDLISDTDNSLMRLYHVPFWKGSLHTRVTFVIDKKGTIRNVIQYTNDAEIHIKEALTALKRIG